MQDNALTYTANMTEQWFEDRGIDITDQRPYSLELSLIEHA